MDEAIQKAGAEACARGESYLANPYLRSDAMPATTGEGISEWMAKHDAWHFGWTIESVVRT